MGVFDPRFLRTMAEVLRSLGARRAMIVHGSDGMDELTVTGPSDVVELYDGRIRRRCISPETVGLGRWPLSALRGGGPRENARQARAVLAGVPGAARDITLLNAAAALRVGGMVRTLRQGVALAAISIDRGMAAGKLEQVRRFCETIRSRVKRG